MATHSMKLPALRRQLTQQGRQIPQMLCDEVPYFTGLAGAFIDIALPRALDGQQA